MQFPSESAEEQISRLLEADSALLPFLPALLGDLESLGSSPEEIVSLLRPRIGPEAHVLDLGCGLGATTLALATGLNCRVTGIDLFPAFVAEAAQRAAAAGVADRCTFTVAAVQDVVAQQRDYDAVVYAAMGGIFQSIADTIGGLRNTVRTSGWIVLEDGFVLDDAPRPAGYEYYRTYPDTIAELTAHGDAIEEELLLPADQVFEDNERNNAAIAARAESLAQLYPQMAEPLRAFARDQVQYSRDAEFGPTAIWVLRKRS